MHISRHSIESPTSPRPDGRPHGSGNSHPLVNGGAIHVEQPDDISPRSLESSCRFPRHLLEPYRPSRLRRLREALQDLADVDPRERFAWVLIVLLAGYMAWVTWQVLQLASADQQARIYEQEASR